jgi:hypothetical protein
LRIGYINSAVEEAIAIVDFTSRNELPLHSADHDLYTQIASDESKSSELREMLGNQLFSLNAHWFWFSLNEGSEPYTFPKFNPSQQVPIITRLKVAIKILLNHYPVGRFC